MASASERQPTALGALHLRLFALLIDYLLIVVVLNLADQFTLGAGWDLRPPAERQADALYHWLVFGTALILLKDAAFGRSPGKWFTGIDIRDANDPTIRPGRRALILRNLALILLPVEAMLVFADPHCRRLGDRWMGTVVVTPEHVPHIGRRMLVFTSLVLAALLAGFLVAPWNMRRSAAYTTAVRQVERDPRVLARAGEGMDVSEDAGFDLRLKPDSGRATLGFTATGRRGQVSGEVVLELVLPERRWELESLTLEEPPPPEVEEAAPPDPNRS